MGGRMNGNRQRDEWKVTGLLAVWRREAGVKVEGWLDRILKQGKKKDLSGQGERKWSKRSWRTGLKPSVCQIRTKRISFYISLNLFFFYFSQSLTPVWLVHALSPLWRVCWGCVSVLYLSLPAGWVEVSSTCIQMCVLLCCTAPGSLQLFLNSPVLTQNWRSVSKSGKEESKLGRKLWNCTNNKTIIWYYQ